MKNREIQTNVGAPASGPACRAMDHADRKCSTHARQAPSPFNGERFNGPRKTAMVGPERRTSVLPVCNRKFLLRPDCQLQTGSKFMERAGARGDDNPRVVFPNQRRKTNHPSPSIPLPVEGRGKSHTNAPVAKLSMILPFPCWTRLRTEDGKIIGRAGPEAGAPLK